MSTGTQVVEPSAVLLPWSSTRRHNTTMQAQPSCHPVELNMTSQQYLPSLKSPSCQEQRAKVTITTAMLKLRIQSWSRLSKAAVPCLVDHILGAVVQTR